jgi:outer membrane receptor for ferrienterochelin and colicins
MASLRRSPPRLALWAGVGPLLALLVSPSLAEAQGQYEPDLSQADLETLMNTPVYVSTATKTTEKYYDAPAIITTVTRYQIAAWGHRTIAELLNHLLGFYVVEDHISPNVAVRGISGGLYAESSVIKVLVNGQSVAFQSTGGNDIGPELIPLSAIDRVEIIRGPASALYGADAFLGVVNILTRDGADVHGATGSVTVGRLGTHLSTDVDLAMGASHGIVDGMVALRHNQQDLSGLELPATSPAPSIPSYNFGATTARGLTQDSTTAIGTVTVRPARLGELGLFAYYSALDRGAEFGSLFQLANGFNAQGIFSENRVSQWQVRSGLRWDRQFSSWLHLYLRGSYFQGKPGNNNRLEVGSDFYYVRREFGFRGTDLEGDAVWKPSEHLRLVAGPSLLFDHEQLPSRIGIAKQQVGDVPTGGVVEGISVHGRDKNFLNAGAYLHGTWTASRPDLGLTAGLRYDHHSAYGSQVSWRLGAVSSPLSKLHLKLLYGTAFKAPPPLLLYAVPSAAGDVIGNPNLKPQYVNTLEFQVAYQPAGWLTISSDVAYNRLTDLTEFIQVGINKVARNVARANSVSWETSVEARYHQWLFAHASAGLVHTTVKTGQEGYIADVVGTAGTTYPGVILHAGIVVQPPELQIRAALLSSYVGTRRATENNIILNGGPYNLPAYCLLEGKITTVGFHILRETGQEISISIAGKNLLNATGPMPGFAGVDYPLSPRAFYVQLNLTL